jgi:hypothetical protein
MEITMRTDKWIWIIIFLVALVTTAGCGPRSVELRLSPSEGESFRFQDHMIQEMNMEIQGLEMSLVQTIDVTTVVDVIEVHQDGQVVVEVSYESMAMEMTAPFTDDISFDTEDETTSVPPEFQGIANMIGKSVTMTLDSRGSVLEMSGYEELIDEVVSGTPPGQPELEGMFENLAFIYDNDSNSGGLTGLIGPMPDGKVAVGDTWTEQVTTDAMFPMTIDAVYTVLSIEAGEITLQMEGEISADLEDFASEFDLVEASIEMSGDQSGELVLDIETGMMVRANQVINMIATVNFYVEELGGDTTIVYNFILTYERSMVKVE